MVEEAFEGNELGRRLSVKKGAFVNKNDQQISQVYDLGQAVGEGTYGCVKKANHLETNQARAVKIIPKAKIKNWKRFTTEVEILRTLDHPNVVRLYEIFEDKRNVYLVMEICTGGELFDRIINKGSFTEKEAAFLFQQIMSAIAYCHSNQIAHRDLKPENFIFENPEFTSTLKIIDFGLSKIWSHDEADAMGVQTFHTRAGTPYYIAPDVLRGEYNQSCDIWSAGVMLYILLCGYPPFYGNSDAQILERVKKGTFSFRGEAWAQVSSQAKELISSMLRMNPAERLEAAAVLHHPWVMEQAPNASEAPIKVNLDNIKSFLKHEQLKKATLNCIASQLQEGEIGTLKATFLAMDTDQNGTLTMEELSQGMQKLDPALAQHIEKMFSEMDADRSGSIDYTEFLAATMERSTYLQEEKLWQAFKMFDKDGSGKISPDELKLVLGSENVSNMKDPAFWEEIIKEVDYNGDGEVDFDEFLQMMYKKSGTK